MQDSGQIRREPMSAVFWSIVPWGANRIALFRFFAFTCTVSIRAHTHELQTFQLILSVLFLRTNGLFFCYHHFLSRAAPPHLGIMSFVVCHQKYSCFHTFLHSCISWSTHLTNSLLTRLTFCDLCREGKEPTGRQAVGRQAAGHLSTLLVED